MPNFSRRTFLQNSAFALPAALAGCASQESAPGAILDTHTHFYDPARPEGVPWPPKDDVVLSRTVLPPEFETLVRPLGVTGTIAVEASPWVEDNLWLLELAERNPFIVGVVGNLQPGTPGFGSHLIRFARNQRFRGIRIGGDRLKEALTSETVRDDLRRVADFDLSLDLLLPPEQLPDAAALSEAIRDLRIIVDHCGNVPVGTPPPNAWTAGLAACHYTPNVFMKVSGLVEGTGRRGGQAPTDPAYYHSVLEAVWHPFGEDRLIYGSNWPVCLHFASYATVLRIVQDYFAAKGSAVSNRFFRRNARHAYQCG